MENSAVKRGGREITRNSVIFSAMSTDIDKNPIRAPLAAPVKRQAAKAARNLPPKRPSRGPLGLITRQTPNSSNLRRKYRVIFDNLRQKWLCYRAFLGISESPDMGRSYLIQEKDINNLQLLGVGVAK